jgi:hypothetical protein
MDPNVVPNAQALEPNNAVQVIQPVPNNAVQVIQPVDAHAFCPVCAKNVHKNGWAEHCFKRHGIPRLLKGGNESKGYNAKWLKILHDNGKKKYDELDQATIEANGGAVNQEAQGPQAMENAQANVLPIEAVQPPIEGDDEPPIANQKDVAIVRLRGDETPRSCGAFPALPCESITHKGWYERELETENGRRTCRVRQFFCHQHRCYFRLLTSSVMSHPANNFEAKIEWPCVGERPARILEHRGRLCTENFMFLIVKTFVITKSISMTARLLMSEDFDDWEDDGDEIEGATTDVTRHIIADAVTRFFVEKRPNDIPVSRLEPLIATVNAEDVALAMKNVCVDFTYASMKLRASVGGEVLAIQANVGTLLSVETGYCLAACIRPGVGESELDMKEVFAAAGLGDEEKPTTQVSTDDPRKWKLIIPRLVNNPQVRVCDDRFHRFRALCQGIPTIHTARQHFFGKLRKIGTDINSGVISTKEQLADRFNELVDEFSQETDEDVVIGEVSSELLEAVHTPSASRSQEKIRRQFQACALGVTTKTVPLLPSAVVARFRDFACNDEKLESLLTSRDTNSSGTNANESFHRELNSRVGETRCMSIELATTHVWLSMEKHNIGVKLRRDGRKQDPEIALVHRLGQLWRQFPWNALHSMFAEDRAATSLNELKAKQFPLIKLSKIGKEESCAIINAAMKLKGGVESLASQVAALEAFRGRPRADIEKVLQMHVKEKLKEVKRQRSGDDEESDFEFETDFDIERRKLATGSVYTKILHIMRDAATHYHITKPKRGSRIDSVVCGNVIAVAVEDLATKQTFTGVGVVHKGGSNPVCRYYFLDGERVENGYEQRTVPPDGFAVVALFKLPVDVAKNNVHDLFS